MDQGYFPVTFGQVYEMRKFSRELGGRSFPDDLVAQDCQVEAHDEEKKMTTTPLPFIFFSSVSHFKFNVNINDLIYK